jgi:chromosome segregation ATPase
MSWPAHSEHEKSEPNSQRENQRLEAELSETQNQIAELTRELNEARPKLTELTNERTRLEGANWALQFELSGWRKQVERLARQVYETRQDRETMQALNRQLQVELRETKYLLDELDAKHRIDDLEKRVEGIYQSRIWRTLVALSSPVEKLFRPREK